jgi:hypothetical protein
MHKQLRSQAADGVTDSEGQQDTQSSDNEYMTDAGEGAKFGGTLEETVVETQTTRETHGTVGGTDEEVLKILIQTSWS